MIEVENFRLRPDTDPAAFTALDADFQQKVAYRLPGLLRRTTATADDGSWIVITLWDDQGPRAHDDSHPSAQRRNEQIDAGTITRALYRELPG